MQARVLTIMLTGAIGLFSIGCATSSPTMRAQSPYGGCDTGHGAGNHNCQVCDSGFAGAGVPLQAANCDSCDNCTNRKGRCLNLPFHPVHRNFHTFDVPTDLVYPEASQNPAMYQYPYYTHRGPTDFFMK